MKQQKLLDAKNFIITFGKHRGKTLLEIATEDYKYLERLLNTRKIDKKIKQNIMMLMYGSVYLGDDEK